METKKTETLRTGMKVGAVLGGIAFLIFGIVPGFHYGGYGSLMLLNKVLGGPLEATLAVRMFMVFGIALGILCLGFMSIVLGSVFGTASGYIVHSLSALKAPEGHQEMVNNNK